MRVCSGLEPQPNTGLAAGRRPADTRDVHARAFPFARRAAGVPSLPGRCASSGAVPRPFPAPRPARSNLQAWPMEAHSRLPTEHWSQTPSSFRGAPIATAAVTRTVSTAAASSGTCSRAKGSPCRAPWPRSSIPEPVRPDALRPGDLVFFHTGSGPASHVGMVVGHRLVRACPELAWRRAHGAPVRAVLGRAVTWARGGSPRAG